MLLLSSLLLSSCQEEVFLPLDQNKEGIPVIEALWTDQGIYNEVKFPFPIIIMTLPNM